ncbi:MAG: hypothetical protein R2755_16495 [Acidimicrobiales bacterium]
MTRPKHTAPARLVIDRLVRSSTATMITPTTPMTEPQPSKRENAAPVLKARLNRSEPMRSIGSSSVRAQYLVTWSSAMTVAMAEPINVHRWRDDSDGP